jgi:hypothetical protein
MSLLTSLRSGSDCRPFCRPKPSVPNRSPQTGATTTRAESAPAIAGQFSIRGEGREESPRRWPPLSISFASVLLLHDARDGERPVRDLGNADHYHHETCDEVNHMRRLHCKAFNAGSNAWAALARALPAAWFRSRLYGGLSNLNRALARPRSPRVSAVSRADARRPARRCPARMTPS